MNARSKIAMLLLLPAAAFALGATGVGCSSNEKMSGVAGAKLPEGSKSEAVEHESCEEKGHRVETLDANGDGKSDIKRVYDAKTNKETCRITDLDHDGKPDMFEYYDASGELRRREADYDDSGVVDTIEHYEHGKLARRELDTTGQHRIDTWDFFDTATGKRVRRERDSTNDGRVDQWWTWQGEAVTIAMDKNGDGKPDPESTVVIGGVPDAGAPAPSGPETLDAGFGPGVPDASSLLPQAAPAVGIDLDAGAVKEATTDGGKPKGGKK
jgi:hypothetical protein